MWNYAGINTQLWCDKPTNKKNEGTKLNIRDMKPFFFLNNLDTTA